MIFLKIWLIIAHLLSILPRLHAPKIWSKYLLAVLPIFVDFLSLNKENFWKQCFKLQNKLNKAIAYKGMAMPTLKGRAMPKIYEKGYAQNKG